MGSCCVKYDYDDTIQNEHHDPSLVLVCDESELNSTKTRGFGSSLRTRSKLHSHIENDTPLSSMENIFVKT